MRRFSTATVLLISWLGLAAPAAGDTFKPTRLTDPGAAKCTKTNCSLRGAISAANRNEGADRVVLGEGTYELALTETAENDNAGGDLDVKGPVRIIGRGSALTTVDANGGSRVFSLLKDPPKSLERMSIVGGAETDGGGVYVSPAEGNGSPGQHKLRELVIRDNDAARGGGIFASSQVMKITRTTIRDNEATSGGGGMYVAGAPTLGSATPPIKIRASTFAANTAGLGGGIYVDGAEPAEDLIDPRVDALNTTFAHNLANVSGGGIASILGAAFYGEHVTVAYNSADLDSSGGGNGGGVYQSTDAVLEVEYSLVKENSVGLSGAGPQCAGVIDFKGVITPQGTPGLCTFQGGSVIQGEVEPRIGPLANYGGPTLTVEILADSLANGWRDVGTCPAKDQRGAERPATDCDVGAFERP